MLSPRQYADTIGRSYSTVDTWLRAGKIPGVVETEIAGKIYYEIPEGTPAPSTAGRGRPPKAKTDAAPDSAEVKPGKKGAKKK